MHAWIKPVFSPEVGLVPVFQRLATLAIRTPFAD